MIFGIASLGVSSMLGAGGESVGYVMVVVDPNGQKFYVDIPESVYKDLVGIYALSVQKFQDVSMGTKEAVQEEPVPVSPTGTTEEVERMRAMMMGNQGSDQMTQPVSSQDVMKKLGFVSDDTMRGGPQMVDPVDDVLSLASEDEDYEDPGEGSFNEDVEGI